MAAVDRRAALLGLVTVVAANGLYLAGLPAILDAMLSMDPYYMRMASLPAAELLRQDPSWGPLYAWWLKPLRAALGDPLAVNTANILALSLAVTLALYAYLLALTQRAAVAVGGAFAVLVSDFNLPLSGKVSSFALLVLLVGLTAAQLTRAGARRLSVAALASGLAGYARPELYPAALALCAMAFWQARREARAWYWPAAALVLLGVAAVAIGWPLSSAHDDQPRLLIAFREHFAWNWVRWHHTADYRSIWQTTFGEVHSIGAALIANPGAVALHLGTNLAMTAWFLATTAFDHYPLLVPANAPRLVQAENLAAAVVALGALLAVARRPPLRRDLLARHGQTLLLFAVVSTCPIAAAIAIYPVTHYLLIPAVLLGIIVALAAAQLVPAGAPGSTRAAALAALVCLAAVPRPFVLPASGERAGAAFVGRITVTRPVRDTVELIRTLGLPPPVQVLTLKDGFGDLLGAGYEELKAWQVDPRQPLATYLTERGVDVIVSFDAGRYSFMLADDYWPKLQEDPAAAGFVRLAVPDHPEVSLFVRRALLPAAAVTNPQSPSIRPPP